MPVASLCIVLLRGPSVLCKDDGADADGCERVQELSGLLSGFDSLVTGQVLPVLKILVEDEDRDVRFFAGQALLHFTE